MTTSISYARNNKEVISYLESAYGIEIITKYGDKAFLTNNYFAEFGATLCDCGETAGCTIFNSDLEVVEVIAICEDCWENNPFDRI